MTRNQITHEDFKSCVYKKKAFSHTVSKILQEKCKLYTADIRKVTLSPFNDKKLITREGDNFISYSFGNKNIPDNSVDESLFSV